MIKTMLAKKLLGPIVLLASLVFSSCSKEIGWGVLLWSLEDPPIPSGTVLPVYARSNIEEKWFAGIPGEYRTEQHQEMAEIPLPHLELFNSKGAAAKRAAVLAEYAIIYAEVLQDGLPIRDKPENNAKRVYRLKEGEVIKIIEKTGQGIAAISTAGSPLEGDWFTVLTESGSTGFCFSYRLRLFEHTAGPLVISKPEIAGDDPELDIVLSRTWYPESYKVMVNSGNPDLNALSKHWGFLPGTDTGKAKISLTNADLTFPYKRISKISEGSWVFEGSPLLVTLQGDSNLAVQYDDEGGVTHTAMFVTLPASVDAIINREMERRQNLYQALFVRGPTFYSANYGSISFTSNMRFTWDEMGNLPSDIYPASALGSGSVDMGIYLQGDLAERYTGGLILKLDAVSGVAQNLHFIYTLDNQGLRMEFVPRGNMNGTTVTRREGSALVIYFSAD
jgi:hypothetical protein